MPDELDLRKGIHIKLLPRTHAEFRVVALRAGLSMQEIMEEFAQRVVAGERYCTRMVDELVERKRLRISTRMSPTDAESLFDILEAEDILKESEDE
jgi:hypothetical protein